MIREKKILYCLALVLLLGIGGATRAGYREAPARGVYGLPELFGTIADFFLSRGKMSEKHVRLFEEVAQELRIEHRGIKLRNSGFLLRLLPWIFPPWDTRSFLGGYLRMVICRFEGYYGIQARQSLNRVYINEDWLNQMTEEQKRFVIAHGLTYHSQAHGFVRAFVFSILGRIAHAVRTSQGSENQKLIMNLVQIFCVMQFFQHLEQYSDEQAAELSYCSQQLPKMV